MRKKSHISLAKHIVNVSGLPSFDKHRKAFYVGSIMPDCRPSFLTRRHEIQETYALVEKKIRQLIYGYDSPKELSTIYFEKLGEVIHYIADYFTFPHNREYPGTVKEHCVYEGRLKHKLRAYIRNLDEKQLEVWKYNLHMEDMERFQSVADICNFLKEEHRNYIRRGHHSVEEDCRYIVGVCTRVTMAILHVCRLTMQHKKVYAIVR